MNSHLHKSICSSLLIAALSFASVSQAETLLVQRVRQERGASVPTRGMSMTQVESTFGAPSSKLSPAGGDTPHHPVIHRWVYDSYTVYFEHEHVIDSVLNRASATEIGPKGTSGSQ